jgi:hypothetical protein
MATRFAGMFIDIDQDRRLDPPGQAAEASTLQGFVRWQRETLELKCAGLDPEQLARRGVPPSTLSLLGLVRHLADVERGLVSSRSGPRGCAAALRVQAGSGRRLQRRGGRP